MHHLARLARLDNQRRLRARTFPHQMVVHGRHGEEARNRRIIRVDAAIRKNQDSVPVLYRERCPPAEPVERALQAFFTFGNGEQGR